MSVPVSWRRTFLLVLSSILTVSCADTPPPRPVYQDQLTAIRLQVDERSSVRHSHPAHLSPEQMTRVLVGVRVIPRQGFLASAISGAAQAGPGFSTIEIQSLAPQLSRALEEARPDELVTFYRRYSDAGTGLAVTSGGLFVQGKQLYFILANHRNLPSDSININQVYEIDPIENPLLPITRTTFRASFSPESSLVPSEARGSWPYIDEGRVLVLDLAQSASDKKASPSSTNP